MSDLVKKEDAALGEIPNLIKTVNETTEIAIRQINEAGGKKGEVEVRKQEAIRDIAMKAAEEVEVLWNRLIKDNVLPDREGAFLRKYANYFVRPLVELMDVARKANVDIYEMKYGRKVQHVGEVEKFDDFVRRKMTEISAERARIIDVTGNSGTDDKVDEGVPD